MNKNVVIAFIVALFLPVLILYGVCLWGMDEMQHASDGHHLYEYWLGLVK